MQHLCNLIDCDSIYDTVVIPMFIALCHIIIPDDLKLLNCECVKFNVTINKCMCRNKTMLQVLVQIIKPSITQEARLHFNLPDTTWLSYWWNAPSHFSH